MVWSGTSRKARVWAAWLRSWPPWSLFATGSVSSHNMDQIFIETPNPKCRLYWCLIVFIDWRYSQSCWYFQSLLWTSAPLTFSLVCLPCLPPLPLPCVNKYRPIHSLQCITGGGGEGMGLCGEHIQEYRLCIWPDSEPTKFLYHPKQNLGGEVASDR